MLLPQDMGPKYSFLKIGDGIDLEHNSSFVIIRLLSLLRTATRTLLHIVPRWNNTGPSSRADMFWFPRDSSGHLQLTTFDSD